MYLEYLLQLGTTATYIEQSLQTFNDLQKKNYYHHYFKYILFNRFLMDVEFVIFYKIDSVFWKIFAGEF